MPLSTRSWYIWILHYTLYMYATFYIMYVCKYVCNGKGEHHPPA
jgi:hypothetical protein